MIKHGNMIEYMFESVLFWSTYALFWLIVFMFLYFMFFSQIKAEEEG